jgi:hypothetical protein
MLWNKCMKIIYFFSAALFTVQIFKKCTAPYHHNIAIFFNEWFWNGNVFTLAKGAKSKCLKIVFLGGVRFQKNVKNFTLRLFVVKVLLFKIDHKIAVVH